MLFKSVVSVAVLVGSAVAQTNHTKLDDGGASVPATTKASWCIGQRAACDTLCSKNVEVNDCKTADLTWNCVCGGGESPEELPQYIDTIPYFICQESYGLCIKAHPDDALGQENCNTNIRDRCGDLNIKNFTGAAAEATTTETTAAATTTATSAVVAATGAGGDASSASSAAPAATTTAGDSGASTLKGSIVLVGGILAAFGFML